LFGVSADKRDNVVLFFIRPEIIVGICYVCEYWQKKDASKWQVLRVHIQDYERVDPELL
jgi:hypothetical protein